jgi:uncharacterized protein (TIGR03000 family)
MICRVLQRWSVPVLALAGVLLTTGFAAAQYQLGQGEQLYNWLQGSSASYGSSRGGARWSVPYRYGARYRGVAVRPWIYDGGYSTPYYSDAGPYYREGDRSYTSSSAYAPLMSANDDKAHVLIRVPSDRAEVWIERQKTTQDRPAQEYISPPLDSGKKYYYEIRARWTDQNNRTIDETRTFPITAGGHELVDFGRPAPSDQKVTSPKDSDRPRDRNSEDRDSQGRDPLDRNSKDRNPQDQKR